MFKIPAFICDIDGTLTDHTGIRGHYEYGSVSLDRPIYSVIEVIEILAEFLQPVFVSGRRDSESCRSDTRAWINKYTDIKAYPLLMRPEKLSNGKPDYRPDYIVKEELYRTCIEPYYDIRFAIDDRLQVCRMWYSIGIPVFRVGDPDADF